ncbi:MAG: hypothetical protein H9901_00130 [Candidatus Paralactobacillus gallistercoris]|uniref:Uncharacterized protein n=1 Tax=Candidatus Paralactobacillus gallistercoris TaxID=2838724 RepID=A0A948TI91_9LACO|nr:hypothetical protein [Candidatus Paralactobacillus gallistercoris]
MALILIIPTGILVKTSNELTLINAPYPESELGFPVINWPLMALNDKDASYNDATMHYTARLKKHHSVAEVAKIEEKQYLQESLTHPLKFIGSLFTHIKKIYTDGTDGSLLLTTWSADNNGEMANLVSKMVYVNSPYRNVYLAWTTAFNLTMILLILIGVIIKVLKKEPVAYVDALILTVLGNMLLLLVWEARSRYLLMIEPIIICLACWGMNQILMNKQLLLQKAKEIYPKIKKVVNK